MNLQPTRDNPEVALLQRTLERKNDDLRASQAKLDKCEAHSVQLEWKLHQVMLLLSVSSNSHVQASMPIRIQESPPPPHEMIHRHYETTTPRVDVPTISSSTAAKSLLDDLDHMYTQVR